MKRELAAVLERSAMCQQSVFLKCQVLIKIERLGLRTKFLENSPMVRIIRLENQRRFAAKKALRDTDQSTCAAVRDHYFERTSVNIDVDIVVFRDLCRDGLAQTFLAFATAVMVLACGDNVRCFLC